MALSSPEWLRVFFYRVWPFVSLDLGQVYPPFVSLDLGPVEFGLRPCGVLDLGPVEFGLRPYGVLDLGPVEFGLRPRLPQVWSFRPGVMHYFCTLSERLI